MGDRLRAAILAGFLGALVAMWAIPAAAEAPLTFADRFTSQAFSGNDGNLDFTQPWIELGESNGPDQGPVYVWSGGHCASGSGWCLKVGGNEVDIDGHGVVREADTSGATAATLRYSFRRVLFDDYDHGEWVKVQVSGDGGESWKTVARHKLDRNDTRDVKKTKDITAYTGPHTQIRFIGGPAGSVDAYIFVDNIEIEITRDLPPPTSTTTTPPSTTTTSTQPPSTTTTQAPSTTTSTTSPASVTSTTAATLSQTTTTIAAPSDSSTSTTAPPPAGPTTTTVALLAVATDLPPTETSSVKPAPPPVPGTPESFVSKVGLTMTDAMPSFDGGDGTGTPSGDGAALERTPLERLGVTFATTAETVRNHTAWAIALGVIVAWLALRGLGKTRRREAGNRNENGAAYRSG